MFDDLLAKLIDLLPESIRERLPERFRGEDSDDDEVTGEVKVDVGDVTQVTDGDEVEEDSDRDDDDEDEEEDDDDEEEDEAAKKKKHRSRLIKIVVIGALVWFGLDEFHKPEQKPKKGGAKKNARQQKKKTPKKSQVIKQKEVVAPTPEPIPTQEPEPISEPTPEPTPEPTVQPAPKTVAPEKEEEEGGELDSALVLPDQVMGEVEEQSAQDKVNDQITKYLGEDLSDGKATKLEQPNYERIGEGLVYNCKGHHWACVDRKNYFRCRELELSVGDGQPDCVISETYATIEDCQTMQVYRVNRGAPPESCKFSD